MAERKCDICGGAYCCIHIVSKVIAICTVAETAVSAAEMCVCERENVYV